MTTYVTIKMTEAEWQQLLAMAKARQERANREHQKYLKQTGRTELLIPKKRKKFIPEYDIVHKETICADHS